MQTRLRLLMGATALLYLGPLMAGLGGFGWAVVPAFVAIFVLWLQILRPHEWPRDPKAWARRGTWARAAARVAVQVLLVTVLFGVGRGIGGVLGTLPMFHPALPVGLSFLSIPLARLVWDPWKMQAAEHMLDDALAQLRDPGWRPRPQAEVQKAVDALLDLPDGADPQVVRALLDEALGDETLADDAHDALAKLAAALEADDGARPVLRAEVVLWATDPARVAAGRPFGLVARGFQAAGCDSAALHLFLPRALALIEAFPDRAGCFPLAADMFDTLSLLRDPATREDMLRLIRAVERLRHPDGEGAGGSAPAAPDRLMRLASA